MATPHAPTASALPLRRAPLHSPLRAIELYDRPSAGHADKVAHSVALLRSVAATHPRLVQASSLGAEDMVVTHLVELAGLQTPVAVLDTGHLHGDTLTMLEQLRQRLGPRLEVWRPDPEAVHSFVHTHGERAMYDSVSLRKACCAVRKLQPLARALAGRDGWITGLRREQSTDRAEVPAREHDTAHHLLKLNPLHDWTWGDVWHHIARHRLAHNPLHDRFYPSIGCAPCTRAISLGEDLRAGRWWWEQDGPKECGLHTHPDASAQPIPPTAAAAARRP